MIARDYVEQIERERTERASRMTPGERVLAGPRLFDMACRFARAGIRAQFPGADHEEVERILAQRLAIRRQDDTSTSASGTDHRDQ